MKTNETQIKITAEYSRKRPSRASDLDCVMSAPKPPKTFDKWITAADDLYKWDRLTPTEQMRIAWNAALLAAGQECRTYGYSNSNVYRRNVAYACERRVVDLMEKQDVPEIAVKQPRRLLAGDKQSDC